VVVVAVVVVVAAVVVSLVVVLGSVEVRVVDVLVVCVGAGCVPALCPNFVLLNGASWSCFARCLVSAGRPVGTAANCWTAPESVPFSPGWTGRYAPFGHQI
jgi:hypothetical protein